MAVRKKGGGEFGERNVQGYTLSEGDVNCVVVAGYTDPANK